MNEHKDEIVSTRTGCLGGSDAKMIANIADKGEVAKSAMKRLAVCKGLLEHEQFSTAATNFGNEIEAHIFDMLHSQDERWQSNPCLTSEKYSRKNFKVIDHIDFYMQDDENKVLYIGECKATKLTFEQTRAEYKYQLYHHFLLGKEQAEKLGGYKVVVQLCHYCTDGLDLSDHSSLNFDMARLKVSKLKGLETKSRIYRIEEGVDIIDNFLENFNEYYDGDEIDANLLPAATKKQFEKVTAILTKMAKENEVVEQFKQKLFDFMSAKKIKSIKNECWSITRVDATTLVTIDAKKFWEDFVREHPRKANKVRDQYTKVSNKKGYCQIKIK